MASLANASPPIALGALDGRYRAAVAPLVDHLSEAALNRERVRVEVEWLIHLTDSRRRAGRAPPHRRRAVPAARGGRGLRPRRRRRAGRDRARDRARRQGRRVLPQAPPGRHRRRRRGPHRAGPLRLHQRGHQQPLLRADGARRGHRGLAAPGHRAGRRHRRHGPRPARRAAARAHPRPARHPDHDGQGAGRARRPAAPAAAPDRRRGVPRQAQRRDRHVRRAPRRGARRGLAGRQPRVRRGPRA